MLTGADWGTDEPWTPFRRDLSSPIDVTGVRVEVVGPELAAQRSEVQRAAFEGSTFTIDRWSAMVAGPLYREARCLLATHTAMTGELTNVRAWVPPDSLGLWRRWEEAVDGDSPMQEVIAAYQGLGGDPPVLGLVHVVGRRPMTST